MSRVLLTLLLLTSGVVAWAAPIVPPNGLVGYWTGNGNANDSSSTANNGNFAGAYVTGTFGQQAFNLATGIVTIPDNAAYSFNQTSPGWTVGFWFDGPAGINVGQDVGSGCQSKWFVGYGYHVGNAFVEHFNNPGCANEVFLASHSTPYPSGWNQLTVVNGGGNSTFYLNGQNIGSDAYSAAFPNPPAALAFGYLEPCCGYGGLLQDVVLYDRPLSASEVAGLAGTSSVPEPATLGLLLLVLPVTLKRLGRYR